MKKYLYLLYKHEHQSHDDFRDRLLDRAKKIQNVGARQLRLIFHDSESCTAEKLLIKSCDPAPVGVATFWINGVADELEAIEEILKEHCETCYGYEVSEREPLPNTQHPPTAGKRAYGMNQVVLFRKLPEQSYQEWLDIWQNSHVPIALKTQSTFGYRHNIIEKKLSAQAPEIDAVVEENFPPEAMTSSHAFYDAIGNYELMKSNRQKMADSISRFIDLNHLDCIPMSEYNF